jgi:hypothetical protein
MLVDDELLLEIHLDWQSCGSNARVEVSRTTAAMERKYQKPLPLPALAATMSNISARHKLSGYFAILSFLGNFQDNVAQKSVAG